MNDMKNLYRYTFSILVAAFLLSSCSESLDTESSRFVTSDQISDLASSNPDALALVIKPQIEGMYGLLVAFDTYGQDYHDDYGLASVLHIADMMGEDVVQVSGSYNWYYDDYKFEERMKDDVHPAMIWMYLYRIIKVANDVIGQIPAEATDNTLASYRGQALAMRAMMYHYLVQFYQKTYVGHEDDPAVPLVTEIEMSSYPRATMRQVYSQMVTDLSSAITLLNGYTRSTKGSIDANVAHGLLARVYLSMENWSLAESEAHAARQGYTPMTGEEYLDGFKNISNHEWMFGSDVTKELEIVQTGICNFPSFVSSFSYGYAALTGMFKAIDKRLYDHMNASDVRKKAYQASDLSTFPDGGYGGVELPAYVNGKFGASDDGADNTQDLVYMRAAEMYLIEAEAMAMQGNTTTQSFFNTFMQTRDPNYSAPSGMTDLLAEIRTQRRIELWGEIGIGLFDIKRLKLGINRQYDGTNHPVDAQLTIPAESWKFTYQLPKSEVDNNAAIGESDNNPAE
jgi:starch-binding outer membrane protein, SusD/RagB family